MTTEARETSNLPYFNGNWNFFLADDVRQSLLTDIQDGLDVIRSDKQQGTEERENKVKKELDNLTSYNSLV